MGIIIASCDVKPQPINYGNESCASCNMTIVNPQFASQMVNDKGRAFNFDAIECMVNYHHEHQGQPASLFLANDFKRPGELINATDATFLISEEISSPMGANLSGYKTEAEAEATKNEYGGKLYKWEELLNHFKNI